MQLTASQGGAGELDHGATQKDHKIGDVMVPSSCRPSCSKWLAPASWRQSRPQVRP